MKGGKVWNEEDKNYCPFWVGRDTIQEFNRFKVDPQDIPPEGTCSVSESGRESCQYPFDKSVCPKKNKQDFCDRSWARGDQISIWEVVRRGNTDLK